MGIELFFMIYLLIMTIPTILLSWYITIEEIKDYPRWIAKDSLAITIFLTIICVGIDILFFLYFFR